MIAYVKGLLIENAPSHVILDVNGIGYKIYTPIHLFSKLPELQATCLLYTSFVIRENSQTLYGFLTPKERDLFEVVQNVSGIGPKIALCIIGHLSVKELYFAISQHDIATLSKIPGIGKKTAERLIIEMRDKMVTYFKENDFLDYALEMPTNAEDEKVQDAMCALISLGYNQITAQKAIKKTLKESDAENFDLSQLISRALQNIS